MGGRKKFRRPNAKGRNDQEQYLAIPYAMARSPAFRNLGGAALKVWVELRSRYNGGNNGDLSLSLDEGSKLLSMGKATVQRGLNELEAKGFIKMTKRGHWYGRKATTWAVTDISHKGHIATRDWKSWKPETPKK
tara:strand:+ start:4924 stop:5325 length:402 start_codon:yes stop_codon:yes gene_type:complete